MWLLILALILLALTIKSRKRYLTLINPITVFVVWDFFLFTILPISFTSHFVEVPPLGFSEFEALQYTYILGGIVGFTLFSLKPYRSFFSIGSRFALQWRVLSPGLICLLLVASLFLLFFALASVGGGGSAWLTDTRHAYINNRSGAGIFWLLIQWTSLAGLGYFLLRFEPKSKLNLLLLLLPFLVISYFTGSKANILSVLVIGVVYHDYFNKSIRPLSGFIIILSGTILFTVLLGIQSRQGDFSFIDSGLYFSEYSLTTAMYLSDEFLPLGLGQYSISSLWYFVPRSLYPDKPFEYGVLNIHKVLFPAAAAKGNTPGISQWMLAYIDFGRVGVFMFGVLLTSFSRFIYNLFENNKDSVFLFVIMIHVCIFKVLSLWPALATILILWFVLHFRYHRKYP